MTLDPFEGSGFLSISCSTLIDFMLLFNVANSLLINFLTIKFVYSIYCTFDPKLFKLNRLQQVSNLGLI
jgi:hypothetical protein